MTAIKNTTTTTGNQVVSTTSTKEEDKTPKTGDSEFDLTFKSLIRPDGQNQVSEEEVFSTLVQERIKKLKGEESQTEFKTALSSKEQSMMKADGFIPVEDATKAALAEMVGSGKLTVEEADKIYSESFAAAQLDDNKEALFDNRGGPGDTSIAVSTLEQALLSSRVQIEKYDSGEEQATMRSLSEVSAGKGAASGGGISISSAGAAIGGAGFLFKPVSDSDGKLAVLLPPSYSGLVQSMRLIGPGEDILEEGRYGGNGNGGREHFRFSKPGGSYPSGVIVETTLNNGEKVRYQISNPSQRTENLEPITPSAVAGTGDVAGSSAEQAIAS